MDTSVPTRPPRSRLLQFNLRATFIAVALCCLVVWGARWSWNRTYYESNLRDSLKSRGADVTVSTHQAKGLLKYLFYKPIYHINSVQLVGQEFDDEDFATLAALKHLQQVDLRDTKITVAAADRLADAERVEIQGMDPCDVLYCGNQSLIRYLSPVWLTRFDGIGQLHAHRAALEWKLACAPLKVQPDATELAYRQCLASLYRLEASFSPNASSSHPELVAVAIAEVEQKRDIARGDTAAARRLGEAWLRRAQDLPALALADQPKVVSRSEMFNVLAALELSYELRTQTARLQGDRQAELQAVDEVVQFGRQLTNPPEPPNPSISFDNDLWRSRLVVWLTGLQIARDETAGKSISEARDKTLLRRIHAARRLLLASWEAEVVLTGECLSALELFRRLEVEVARRRPTLVNATKTEQEYNDFLLHLAMIRSMKCEPGIYPDDAILHCLILRRQLEQHGPAVYQWTQREVNDLMRKPTPRPWRADSEGESEVVDWERELQTEGGSVN